VSGSEIMMVIVQADRELHSVSGAPHWVGPRASGHLSASEDGGFIALLTITRAAVA
jgi:hypothetical protein